MLSKGQGSISFEDYVLILHSCCACFPCRELCEECGAVVEHADLLPVGINVFEFVGNPVLMEVHVFIAERFSG